MRFRWAALAATLAWSNAAVAADKPDPGAPAADPGPPVNVELTDATTVIYAWNNRNFASGDAATVADDNWGVWYNRLHAQVTRGAFRFGFRLDNAWFYTSPNPTSGAVELSEHRAATESTTPLPVYFRQKEQEVGQELSNRYINWIYPAKIYASYSERAYDVTVGDGYAELGHGMVLSVRKRDELSSDDTVRGVRASGEMRVGDARVRLMALGGSLNPLRMDEGTGRYLGVDASVTRGWLAVTEAGMPRAISTDFSPQGTACATTRTCTYAPDRVVAGSLTADLGGVSLATQGSMLVRQAALHPDAVRSADIATVSESATFATHDGRGGLALDVAEQKLSYANAALSMPAGYGVYATGSYDFSPLVVQIEGRHYRRLFPLYANVNIDSAREFSQVAWSAPPTTEAQYIDTEFGNFATCVSGGRGRADYALVRGVSAFAWVGYWQTFAELTPNERCDTARELRNDVADLAAGVELRPGDARSRATITLGGRVDESAVPQPTLDGPTRAYYREAYLRYDVVQALGGPFALELHGWHRRRHEPLGPQLPAWWEGEHTTGLDVGEAWAFAFGAEYDTDIRPPTTYFNGTVRYKPTSDSSIGLFVGQRRGALRCVGGVCRVVPGLEGIRLDASVRF
ncbi:MAG TPA: DUF6029 family protein [Polyangiaceae bacterium]|nr:DUF6029 family protein [Polyangiaceae bacterium]